MRHLDYAASPGRIFSSLFVFGFALSQMAFASTKSPLLYVSDQEQKRIIVIDPEADRIVNEIKLAHGPAELAFGPQATLLYASHPDAGEISTVALQANSAQTHYAVSGSPFGIASVAEGSVIYGDWAAGTLTRIDLQTGESSGVISVGHSPAAIISDRRGRRLYAAVREDNAISVIDAKSFKVIGSVSVGRSPFALSLSPDEDRLYVANVRDNTVSMIGTDDLKVSNTISAGVSPYGLAVTPDGRQLLVTNQQTDTLTIIDTQRFKQLRSVKVGRLPEGLSVVPAVNKAYVMNWFSGDISVIDLASGDEITRIKTGGSPRVAINRF